MKVADAVDLLDGRTLEQVLHFWNAGRADWPENELERRKRLKLFMVDAEIIDDRFARLPPIPHELLTYVMRGTVPWHVAFDLKDLDLAHLSLDEPSVHAAGRALAERGFFAVGRVRNAGQNRVVSYFVPEEIGRRLSILLDSRRRPFEASLSLRAYRRFEGIGAPEPVVDETTGAVAQKTIAERRAAIGESWIEELWPMLLENGGILDADARERLEIEADRAEWERRGRLLETHELGSFESRDLTNHGLRIGDGWLVLFEEVVEEELAKQIVDPEEAEGDLHRPPDFLADVANLVQDLESTALRRKKTGEYMKTSMKRLVTKVLSPGWRSRDPEEDVMRAIDFLVGADLVTFGTDGQARPTPKWRIWERRGTAAKLKDALQNAVMTPGPDMSAFHSQALRRGLLRELKDGGLDKWFPTHVLPMLARNRHLRDAVRGEQARQYQEFHKQVPFPRLIGPGAILRSLTHWMLDSLVRLGMLDVAVRSGEERPWAVRLTSLGAALVGLRPEATLDQAVGLIVNPDHEIVVFPDAASYDLLQKVSRFATRVKADFSIHYKMTRESVQSAAASGMTADQVLAVLAQNSRHPVPQNVEFSVREWSKSVLRITARRAFLLETPTRAAADALVAIPELKNVIQRRLSPTVIELDEDPTQAGIVKLLRDQGFYL